SGCQCPAELKPWPFPGRADRIGRIVLLDATGENVCRLCGLEPRPVGRRAQAGCLAHPPGLARPGLRDQPGPALAEDPAPQGRAIPIAGPDARRSFVKLSSLANLLFAQRPNPVPQLRRPLEFLPLDRPPQLMLQLLQFRQRPVTLDL